MPIRRFLLPVPFPDTLSLSVSSVLHMKTRIFHVNFYGLAANDAGDTSWEEDRPAVLSSEWRRVCVFLRDHSLPHSAKQLEHFPSALNRRDSQPLSPRRIWGN